MTPRLYICRVRMRGDMHVDWSLRYDDVCIIELYRGWLIVALAKWLWLWVRRGKA